MFEQKNGKHRLFFQKHINDFNYFKKFLKPSSYDLYEINFISDDKYLKDGNEKFALLTELKLNEYCFLNDLYSSSHKSTIQLKLIQKDLVLNNKHLNEICQFYIIAIQISNATIEKERI